MWVVGLSPPREEVGGALALLPEATGKQEAADSPTAAPGISLWG